MKKKITLPQFLTACAARGYGPEDAVPIDEMLEILTTPCKIGHVALPHAPVRPQSAEEDEEASDQCPLCSEPADAEVVRFLNHLSDNIAVRLERDGERITELEKQVYTGVWESEEYRFLKAEPAKAVRKTGFGSALRDKVAALGKADEETDGEREEREARYAGTLAEHGITKEDLPECPKCAGHPDWDLTDDALLCRRCGNALGWDEATTTPKEQPGPRASTAGAQDRQDDPHSEIEEQPTPTLPEQKYLVVVVDAAFFDETGAEAPVCGSHLVIASSHEEAREKAVAKVKTENESESEDNDGYVSVAAFSRHDLETILDEMPQ
jgi:hypothetical protein